MAILVDYSRMVIAGIMQQSKGSEIEENLSRHIILTMIQRILKDHKEKYGQLVFAIDDRNYWRRTQFPYYKAKRKEGRDNSAFDWTKLFEVSDKIKQEIQDYFPYTYIHVPTAEADDIIGSLARYRGVDFGYGDEQVMIVAADGDFNQLLKYSNVHQYDAHKKKMSVYDPNGLIQKIVRGDNKDGVPNIRADDDCLVVPGKRQPPITDKIMKEVIHLYDNGDIINSQYGRNWARNKLLIDLDNTPDNIYKETVEKYQEGPKVKNRSLIYDYLGDNKLRTLMDKLNDF